MNFKKAIIVFLTAFVFSGCKTKFDDPNYSSGNADFSRFVAVGGSYMSGFSDNCLYLESQQNSLASILQSRFAMAGGGSFKQPLVNAGNGLGNKYILKYGSLCSSNNAYYLDTLVSDLSNRNWIGNQGSFNNLGVPGAKSFNLNDQDFGRSIGNVYYNRFASDTGAISFKSSTILGDAGRVSDNDGNGPTFFSLWIGLNDFLGYALSGGEADSITPLSIFNSSIDTVITGLSSYSGKGLVANLPDIETLPFFTTLSYNDLVLTQSEADLLNANPDTFNFVEGANNFFIKTPLPEDATRPIKADELILYSAISNMTCKSINQRWGTPQNPIPSKYILDANELSAIHSAIAAFNSKLQSAALSKSLAFVDMNYFFRSLQSGIIFNGVNFNTDYIHGGAFSLDGIHPNPRGYALIANEFIRAINAKYKSTIPEVDANNYTGIRFP